MMRIRKVLLAALTLVLALTLVVGVICPAAAQENMAVGATKVAH